ncbi:MarR family transcriptional regulator [Micromonospora sp. RTP1Z1]|uniref:MarR family transcriptional regulator n=1 Tax=Micromonospora sp. RTP1Z1 TaxID=2994043 RepID=UPI0029C87505|nr:MarR family transcriptional regulator [Micromonospora sp. RTP1Z1]
MTDTPQATAPAPSTIRVLAALAELGEATTAAVAEHAGIGYSTTTPKLRAWEESGQAERFRTGGGRTLWRLTDAGRTATAATSPSRPDGGQPVPALATPDPSTEPHAVEEQPQDGDGSSVEPDDPPAAEGDDEPAESDPGVDVPAAPQAPTTTTSADTDRAVEAPAEPRPEDERHGSEAVDTPQDEARPGKARRAGGSLRGAVLDILEAHPDREYRTGELAKLVDAGNEGTGAAKASPGAVANAVTKLVADGKAVQTVDRPATFQLAPATGGQ